MMFPPTHGVAAASLLQETVALLDAMDVPPPAGRLRLYDNTIRDLIRAGLWSKLAFWYALGAHDDQASLLDWRHPADADMTLVATNSPTFTTDRGWAGDGSTKYLQTTETMNNMAPYALNSAHAGFWSLDNTQANNGDVSSAAGTPLRVTARTLTDTQLTRLNAASNDNIALVDSRGHFLANRSGASAVEVYLNGASIGSNTRASTAVPTDALRGAINTRRLMLLHGGSSLTAGEAATLYAIAGRWKTGIGA